MDKHAMQRKFGYSLFSGVWKGRGDREKEREGERWGEEWQQPLFGGSETESSQEEDQLAKAEGVVAVGWTCLLKGQGTQVTDQAIRS